MGSSGQLKMFETVAVLVVFFFLLGVGSIFYFGMQKSSLQKEQFRASEQFALQIVLRALYMPELDCSFLVTQKDNCIDKLKMQEFSRFVNSTDIALQDYYGEFGYASIKVSEKFPTPSKGTVVYENVPEDFINEFKYNTPVLLYDPISDAYAFGNIEVVVYV